MIPSDALLALDHRHVWHPYAAQDSSLPVYPVASAIGSTLTLTDGRTLIDGMSSWWSAIHGYNHPVLNEAVHRQLGNMAHVMFGGLTHEPAVNLAKTLAALTPKGLEHVFFSDSGSVAVEVAMKMALQYWQARGEARRNRFLALRGGYHGDTFAAMSVCDPVTGMHHLFRGILPDQLFAPRPNCRFGQPCGASDIADFKTLLSHHSHDIAAVILEPIVQGAGGMWFYSADYLKQVRSLCDDHGILLIADEIATGFGRTGKLFACEHAGIAPDILCLGKALTGGYMTLAATLCTQEVSGTVCRGEAGALMHGPTFMANPLACSVASASIGLLLSQDWQTVVATVEQQLHQGLQGLSVVPGVHDVRVLGAIAVIELEQVIDMARMQPLFVEHGIWVRPFGKLVYLMPPFSIPAAELKTLVERTTAVVRHYLSVTPCPPETAL